MSRVTHWAVDVVPATGSGVNPVPVVLGVLAEGTAGGVGTVAGEGSGTGAGVAGAAGEGVGVAAVEGDGVGVVVGEGVAEAPDGLDPPTDGWATGVAPVDGAELASAESVPEDAHPESPMTATARTPARLRRDIRDAPA